MDQTGPTARAARHGRWVDRRRRLRTRRASVLFATAVVLAVLGGCGDDSTGAEASRPSDGPVSLRVGYIPISSLTSMFHGLDEDIFTAEGVEMELTRATGGAELVAALEGGSLDIVYSNYLSIFQAVGQGIDLVVVAAGDSDRVREVTPGGETAGISSLLVLEDGPIESAADLEGEQIAINGLRNVNELGLRVWMEQNGADLENATLVEVAFPAMAAALRGGSVDAAFLTEPFVAQEARVGGLRSLGDPFAAIDPDLPIGGWVATRAWAKEHPEAVDRFRTAVGRVNEAGNALDIEGQVEVLNTHLDIDEEVARKVVLGHFDTTFPADRLQSLVDLMSEHGLLSDRIDVDDVVAAPE